MALKHFAQRRCNEAFGMLFYKFFYEFIPGQNLIRLEYKEKFASAYPSRTYIPYINTTFVNPLL